MMAPAAKSENQRMGTETPTPSQANCGFSFWFKRKFSGLAFTG